MTGFASGIMAVFLSSSTISLGSTGGPCGTWVLALGDKAETDRPWWERVLRYGRRSDTNDGPWWETNLAFWSSLVWGVKAEILAYLRAENIPVSDPKVVNEIYDLFPHSVRQKWTPKALADAIFFSGDSFGLRPLRDHFIQAHDPLKHSTAYEAALSTLEEGPLSRYLTVLMSLHSASGQAKSYPAMTRRVGNQLISYESILFSLWNRDMLRQLVSVLGSDDTIDVGLLQETGSLLNSVGRPGDAASSEMVARLLAYGLWSPHAADLRIPQELRRELALDSRDHDQRLLVAREFDSRRLLRALPALGYLREVFKRTNPSSSSSSSSSSSISTP